MLDPAEPVSIGAMVGPEAFMEVRYLAHAKQMRALELIPGWAEEFRAAFGRESGGLLHGYRIEDADTVVVALGSVLGTIKDTVDEMRVGGDEDRRARHHLLPTLAAGRGARRARRRQARRGAGEEPRRRAGRHRLVQRAHLATRAARMRCTR